MTLHVFASGGWKSWKPDGPEHMKSPGGRRLTNAQFAKLSGRAKRAAAPAAPAAPAAVAAVGRALANMRDPAKKARLEREDESAIRLLRAAVWPRAGVALGGLTAGLMAGVKQGGLYGGLAGASVGGLPGGLAGLALGALGGGFVGSGLGALAGAALGHLTGVAGASAADALNARRAPPAEADLLPPAEARAQLDDLAASAILASPQIATGEVTALEASLWGRALRSAIGALPDRAAQLVAHNTRTIAFGGAKKTGSGTIEGERWGGGGAITLRVGPEVMGNPGLEAGGAGVSEPVAGPPQQVPGGDGWLAYPARGGKIIADGRKSTPIYRIKGGLEGRLAGVAVHELAHSIDHAFRLTSSLAWKAAAAAEAPHLSTYAGTAYFEAFPEFARLLWASDFKPESLEREFPGMAAFFKKERLWPTPEQAAGRTREAFPRYGRAKWAYRAKRALGPVAGVLRLSDTCHPDDTPRGGPPMHAVPALPLARAVLHLFGGFDKWTRGQVGGQPRMISPSGKRSLTLEAFQRLKGRSQKKDAGPAAPKAVADLSADIRDLSLAELIQVGRGLGLRFPHLQDRRYIEKAVRKKLGVPAAPAAPKPARRTGAGKDQPRPGEEEQILRAKADVTRSAFEKALKTPGVDPADLAMLKARAESAERELQRGAKPSPTLPLSSLPAVPASAPEPAPAPKAKAPAKFKPVSRIVVPEYDPKLKVADPNAVIRRQRTLVGGKPIVARNDANRAGIAGLTLAAAQAKLPVPKPAPRPDGTPDLEALRRAVDEGVKPGGRAMNWGYETTAARAALVEAERQLDEFVGRDPQRAVDLAREVTGKDPGTPQAANKALKLWVAETLDLLDPGFRKTWTAKMSERGAWAEWRHRLPRVAALCRALAA